MFQIAVPLALLERVFLALMAFGFSLPVVVVGADLNSAWREMKWTTRLVGLTLVAIFGSGALGCLFYVVFGYAPIRLVP